MIAPRSFRPHSILPQIDLHVRPGAGLLGLALAGALVLAAAPCALAQDASVQGLLDRVERLQRELQTLQRTVYRGEPPPAEATSPTPSAGTLSTTVAARIELRLSQLEAQLRELTGQIEEASYRQTQLRAQIDKLAADTDLRLRQLEQGGVAGANVTGLPSGEGGAQGAGPGGTVASAQPFPGAVDDGSVKVLGTVPADDLEALRTERVEQAGQAGQAGQTAAPGQQTAQAYALPGNTAEEQYKHAFSLLSQANYGEAELALRTFVEQNPDDPLAGNAKYWLGETYYVRQDFEQAAITFAEAYQRYPDNTKAPDNLLKLGMSLAALGSKTDACGTFAELLKRYPNAAVTVQQRAKQERRRLGCA